MYLRLLYSLQVKTAFKMPNYRKIRPNYRNSKYEHKKRQP